MPKPTPRPLFEDHDSHVVIPLLRDLAKRVIALENAVALLLDERTDQHGSKTPPAAGQGRATA